MFRTRDFVLLFTIIVFLVASIGATLLTQWRAQTDGTSALVFPSSVASSSNLVLTGYLPDDTTEADRIKRLNEMRAKVAQVPITIADPNQEPVPVATNTTDEVLDDDIDQSAILCPEVSPYLGFWDSRSLTVTLREGAVVVEHTLEAGPQVILQLPARTLPAATPSCIRSDVIGIANDGSLIRNDEQVLYGIFGSETQIGYALDGMPIYGMSAARGDVCGGRLVDGGYRYELSNDRDTVINCFAATPNQLP